MIKYLIFHVTSRCNSKCKTCFNFKRSQENELSLNEIKKICESLGKIYWLNLSGGEPFLREELPEICYFFAKKCKTKQIIINTGAQEPEIIEEKTKKILKTSIHTLAACVALDGPKEVNDKIRGKGSFENIMETISRLKKLREKEKKLRVGVNVTISKNNLGYIYEIFSLAHKEKLDFYTFDVLRGKPRDKSFIPPNKEELVESWSKISGIVGDQKGYGCFPWLMGALKRTHMERLTKRIKLPCVAGSIAGVIYSNGDVSICELQKPIANLRDYNYKMASVWYSKKAELARKKTKDCYCTHGCFQQLNTLFSIRGLLMLAKQFIS